MKQITFAASALTLAILSSCTQTIVVHPGDTEAAARYGIKPQKSTVSNVNRYNPDAAFDTQVQAYSAEQANTGYGTAIIPPSQPQYGTSTSINTPVNGVLTTSANAFDPSVTAPLTTDAAITNPAASPTVAPVVSPSVIPTASPAAPSLEPVASNITQPTQNQNVGAMNYKVKITNGTTNRLFIEAQDANGTIYPCGFMQAGQSFTTPMEQAQAVAGPVLVVVRDPDQPGAPELRRYRISTPTASYNNKTLHFTVIPKGRYEAAIDDQAYYISELED